MATHSSTLAWKIPWMEEPGRLLSMGSHRVGHDWSDLAAAANVYIGAFLVAQLVKNLPAQETPSSISGLGRSPGEGHGNPLQYSCLENPHEQRSLVGYSPRGRRVRHDWAQHSTNVYISVQFSRSVLSDSLWPHELQHARHPCPSPTPGVHPNSCPSSQWCHPAISSSVVPFSSCSQPLPASESLTLFQWVNSSHEVAKVLEFQLQHHPFQRNPRAVLLQNGLVGSPCSPRDSQESSPTPQFKSINSLALSFLHSPTLTSIHDHRKSHRLD